MNTDSALNILFIHNHFPGQFQHLISYFVNQTPHRVYGICQTQDSSFSRSSNYPIVYTYPKQTIQSDSDYSIFKLRCELASAKATVKLLQNCKQQGIHFDIAVAHTGWGEALFFKEIYPNTPLVGYVEFYYRAHDADAGFDPDDPVTEDNAMRIKTLNAPLLLGMMDCDAWVTPTVWQKSLFPHYLQPSIEVIHEGVDIERVKPNPEICFTLPSGITLTRRDEIVTYCARNLEPYRGFIVFIKAIELICQNRPDCHVLIIGGDEVSYGKPRSDGQSYRQALLKTTCLPKERVHFLGSVSYETYLQVLQLSSVHIYLTYPFVLSWSFMEAMAAECVIVASDTQPVMEVLNPGVNGLTVNFFDYQAIADQVDEVFNHPTRLHHLGEAARSTIMNYYQHNFAIHRYYQIFQKLLAAGKKIHA